MRFRSTLAAPAALLALAGLLAAACGGSRSGADAPPASNGASAEAQAAALANGDSAGGIVVSGQGVAVAEPDVASLSLGVSVLADTARAARDQAAAGMADLIASLGDNGVPEDDYHTSQFSIEPEIDYRNGGEPFIRGYRVTNMLSVTLRDLDRVGEVIDDAVDAVGDPIRVQGVAFSLADPDALESEARALAIADARAKAEELAELAGVSLGKPTAINESSAGPPPVFFRGADAAQEIETPISAGQLEITITVQITYAIT